MILAALALAWPRPAAPDEAFDRASAALAERRLDDAYALLPSIGEPLLAARAEADLWYFARDFGASLAAAERGLAAAPRDLFLLHRALSAALWIRDQERSARYSAELTAALDAAELSPEERAWWAETAAALAASADELTRAAGEREALLGRARAAALGLLGAAALGLLALSRGAPPAQG